MANEVELSDRRLRVRFLLGATSLGGQWLTDQLRSWDQELHGAATVPSSNDGHPTRHRLLGALVEMSSGAPPPVRSLRVREDGGTTTGDDDSGTPRRWLARPVRGLQRRAERLKGRIQARLARWERMGHAEEAEARALVRTGFRHTTAGVLDWLSQQPALRQMVAEQSVGLTRTVLDQMRDVAQDADARAESLIRRLLRRRPRPLPTTAPAPAE